MSAKKHWSGGVLFKYLRWNISSHVHVTSIRKELSKDFFRTFWSYLVISYCQFIVYSYFGYRMVSCSNTLSISIFLFMYSELGKNHQQSSWKRLPPFLWLVAVNLSCILVTDWFGCRRHWGGAEERATEASRDAGSASHGDRAETPAAHPRVGRQEGVEGVRGRTQRRHL